jgi:hypothetical protein
MLFEQCINVNNICLFITKKFGVIGDMLGYYNRDQFAQLLLAAIGENRSKNEFGRQTGVSGSYVSRLSRGIVPEVPSPQIISKFAEKAANGVTFEQLMIAAGHVPDENEPAAPPPDPTTASTSKNIIQLDEMHAHYYNELAGFIRDNNVSIAEMEQLLAILRLKIKKPRKKKKE